METIIDQLDSVNSNNSLENVKDPEKILNLTIKNYNREINWNNLEKFSNLQILYLENCYINDYSFFTCISKIKSLETLKYNHECFFKKSDQKAYIKLPQLKKISFICPSKDEPNLSMLDLYDKQHNFNNFITAFPNYPSAYQNINEIEFVNYESFLEKVKKEDVEYEYSNIYEGKDIYFQCDIYNLLRLKNLKNLKLSENNQDIFRHKLLTEKILSFPNSKKITINNYSIQQYRDKFINLKTLVLNFDFLEEDQRNLTTVNKSSIIKDALEVHFPSQYYQGYTKLFTETLKSKFDTVIICPTEEFFENHFEYFEGPLDFYREKIIKHKSIKSVIFEFNNNNQDQKYFKWNDETRDHSHYFIDLLKETIKKKIKVKINFKNFNKQDGLNDKYNSYIDIFHYFSLLQSNENLKKYLEITNISLNEINKFIEQIYFSKVKTIIVIDDKSKSRAIKKFKDIELLDTHLDDWAYLSTHEGPVDFGKATGKHENSFHDFFEYDFFEYWEIDEFKLNPGCCVPIVRKSYLDNSKKIIFNNLENIHFKYLDVESFPNQEKIFKNKKFIFPKSINFSKIKIFSIKNSPPISLNSLKNLEKLEKLFFINNVDYQDTNWNVVPAYRKLKKIEIDMPYPISNKNRELNVVNIENSSELEDIDLSIGKTLNHDETRWNTTDVDLKNFNKLKKLKKLKINIIDQSLIKNLNNLDSLEELEIINPCMITEDMNPDDGIVQKPLTENDFHFLKNSKKLKKLRIMFPRFGSQQQIDVDIEKFLNFINLDLSELEIWCNYDKDRLYLAHEWYLKSISKFKNIENLKLEIDCNKGCDIKYEYSSDNNSLYRKEKIKREKNAKDPIIIDLKKLKDLKKLSDIHVSFDENIGTRVKNVEELNNLSFNITISNTNIFLTKDIEKIFENLGTSREKYLYNYRKNNPEKEIRGAYDLPDDDRNEYNKIDEVEESNLRINNRSLLTILSERIEKKKKK